MAENRLSLETDPTQGIEQQARRGLKIDASKSKYARKAQAEEEFEKKANAVNEEMNDRKTRAVELVKRFWETLQTKTLLANKGPLQKSLEKEMLTNLIDLAAEMNNDINEKEGAGSVAMITLLFKTVIFQRDHLNELDFKISQLEKKLSKVSSTSTSEPND